MNRTSAILLFCLSSGLPGCANQQTDDGDAAAKRVERVGDAGEGRRLFVEKGCVICHSVNGVGGKAAPPLDAQTQLDVADPVGFASRMWRGAPAMIELQGLELGYSIWLEPQEMVDLATFAANATEQKKLTSNDIDQSLADSLLNERFWEAEDWRDFLKNGQEGAGEPPPDDDRE